MVSCEGIGYPTVDIEWRNSIDEVLSLNASTEKQNTFERTVTRTLMINQGDCRDSYTCVARNMDGSLRMTRTISICNRKCLTIVVLTKVECVCVCVCVCVCMCMCA